MNSVDHFLTALVATFRAVLTASWQGSIAIVLVWLVREALGLRAPARWHYLLWSLVIIRLLVPALMLPHNPASLENIPVVAHPFQSDAAAASHANVPHEIAVVAPLSQTTEPAPAPRVDPTPQAPAPAMRKPWPWWSWGALVWLTGAVVLGGGLAAGAVRFRRRLVRETFPVDEAIEAIWRASCRRWLGRPAPRILAAEWIASPALLGLWRPTLLIPRASQSSFSREDWEHIFAHEIAHLRFRDHWSQILLLLALCVHWFNPLVWVGLRRLRVDRELAADEWALQRLEGERALAYGETLFKTLAARPGHFFQPGLVGISEDGAQMKQRLRRITVFRRRGFYGSLAGVAALLALGAVLLGQGASHTAPAPQSPSAKPEEKSAAVSPQPPATAPEDIAAKLFAAAHAGDLPKVKELLSLPEKDSQPSPLHQAIQALADLMKKRELTGYTLLLDELLKTPIGNGWHVSDPDLASLVQEGRTDFLDALLARKLDLKRLSAPAKNARPPTAEWIEHRVAEVSQQRADIKALVKAAADGDLPTLRRLVEAGVDVNGVDQEDNTPLLQAVWKDRLEAAQYLLDHGALADKPRYPGWDYTPLSEVRSVAMAELLKKAGANVHAKLFGRNVSILTQVAMWRSADLVSWFLQQGLDPKMVGDHNQTLLFYLKDGRTAELLLAAGVDPNQVNDFGQTALSTARSAEVAQALVDHGAKVKGLPEPLLRHMIANGAAPGAVAVAIQAGCDQDPMLLQYTLTNINYEFRDKKETPELEKLRELLIARGAKPYPLAPGLRNSVTYKGKIATTDDAFIDYSSVKVNHYAAFGSPTVSSSSETSGYVDNNGSFMILTRSDATTITVAASADGYATTYAGPLTPPYKETLQGLRLTLGKGYSARIQTVDAAGKPIAGATLEGYYLGPPQAKMAEVRTDASGTAVLEHLGAAPLNVRVGAEGYQSDELVGVHLDPASSYRVTLKPGRALFGMVISQASGQPVAGTEIRLAGVRGPHPETYSDPAKAPLLTTTDPQGRFRLTTLRADSTYYFYMKAPHFGGLFVEGITADNDEMRMTLLPELTVRGKFTHVPAGYIDLGMLHITYEQPFTIGKENYATGVTIDSKVVNGEAEFSIGELYHHPLNIRVGTKEVHLEEKDLPKPDLVIDLGP